jgi:His/Glu/Gln/Arg/opine family amino acid ABC transporter permease subunit
MTMELHYNFNWHVLVTAPYWGLLLTGLQTTFVVTVVSSLASTLLGSGIALARVSRFRTLRALGTVYVEIVRNIPGLFWILFFYFVFPELLPQPWADVLHHMPNYALVAGILGLTIDNAAYLSDILRAGMLAVPSGEKEAARSSGLTFWQECYCIVWPQTLRTVLPPLTNRMIHNFKNSSLCMAIALPELTWATQQIESITFRSIEVTTAATVTYCVLSLAIAYGMGRLYRARVAKRSVSVAPYDARRVLRAYA